MPSSSPTKLLLIRHGETDDNARRVFQGQSGHGLNARGRQQASLLAARLKRVELGAGALYTSDLERARETAEILGEAVGLRPALDPALREIFLGAWQGLTYDEAAARFPDEWSAWKRGADCRRGGGESYAELGERMVSALDRITAAHPGGTVIAVSHGAAIKVFLAWMLGTGVEGMRRFRVSPNTGVTVIERDAEGAYLLMIWNDASHLGDPLLDVFTAPA